MQETRYQLNIGGIMISIILPFEVDVDEKCKPFIVESPREDIKIVVDLNYPDSFEETLIRERGARVWRGKDYYRIERSTFSSQPDTSLYISESNPYSLKGLIYPGNEKRFNSLDRVLALLELEVLWARFHALNLHSSVIRYQDQAILFSAPSGTGKSTQAFLWEQYRGAEIINGDRGLIRKIDGKWRAFGAPFAGSSGIYKNENSPIRAIVVLRQGKENHAEWLSSSAAFRYLYQETVIPRWNDSAHMQIMDALYEIVEEIPICCFHSTPDESAVDALDRFLQEEQNDR